jgi:hypothetical protein
VHNGCVSSLMPVDGGVPDARCKLCGKSAAGPCARCRALVCGDCCELTEGGVTTFAVCLTCARRGTSMHSAWRELLGWLALIVLPLAAIAAALAWLGR